MTGLTNPTEPTGPIGPTIATSAVRPVGPVGQVPPRASRQASAKVSRLCGPALPNTGRQRHERVDDTWDELNAALEHYTAPCGGHAAFTADSRTDEQRAACEVICSRCRITDLCDAYATAANPDGFWAGIDRNPKRKRVASTTDAGAVPSGTQEKEETS